MSKTAQVITLQIDGRDCGARDDQTILDVARENGIDAIGFNAKDVESLGGLRTRLREHLARFKTVLDVWVLDSKPKFLGPQIALGGPTN